MKRLIQFVPNSRWPWAACRLALMVCGLGAFWPGALKADILRLKTGEIVVGRVVRESKKSIVVVSPALGRVTVPRDQVVVWEDSASLSATASPAAVDEPSAPATTPAAAPAKDVWAPPPPDAFDWIQLKSGEWLKGHIRALQERKLEFDSDKLDVQTFDWKDVIQLRSPRGYCLFENLETAVGSVYVDKEFVNVTGAESLRFARSELWGLTSGEPREANYWSGKASLGVNVVAGNTEQTTMTAIAALQRRTPRTRAKLDYNGSYGQVAGVENINSHRVTSVYDIFLTRRLFLEPAFFQYYRDIIANIAHQGTIGFGAGYYIFDRPELEWLVSGGPALQYTKYDTIEAGKDSAVLTPAGLIQTTFDVELTRRLDLILSYQGIVSTSEAGGWTHHSVGTLEFEITKALDLDVTFGWDRTENPPAGAGGVIPEKDDFRLSVGLAVDF